MIQCAKCKRVVTEATFIQIRKSDRAKKSVCYPCHDRLTEYRAKRQAKELQAILSDIDTYKKDWETKEEERTKRS